MTAANALRVPAAISTAAKSAATTTTITPSPSIQQQQQQQQTPPLRPINKVISQPINASISQPINTAITQLKTLVAPNLVRRASLNSVQLKKTSSSSCPAHPGRSKSIISLNTTTAAAASNGSLRPCLRHKRVLSHSCDNLLTAGTSSCRSLQQQQQQQHFRPNSSNASICSSNNNSGKSVKFLLPEKKFVESLNKDDDQMMRRFSIGALVPSSSNPAAPYAWNKALVPNCKQSWQALGPQLLFGQNFDRYYWTSVCCPCYQCQSFPMPYSYNFGHFSAAQFSLTRTSNQQQQQQQQQQLLSVQNNSAKSINFQGCSEQEGSNT